MPEIEINPTTRIEGHHSTTIDVQDGQIASAKSHMEMFRGIENITVGRPPSDVPQITQMVCGVCFTSHRKAATLALEDAAARAGVFSGVPYNARVLQNVMEGMFLLWNHAIHLFTLAGPDYSDAVADTGYERLDPNGGAGYESALSNQRTLLQAFTEFGGRAPHPLTYAPGGVVAQPDAETMERVRERVESVDEWIGPTDAVPEVLEAVRDRRGPPSGASGLYDVLSVIVAAAGEDADEFGVGPGRFYANGMFYDEGGGLVFPGGVVSDGSLRDPSRTELLTSITEDTSHAWYTESSGGHPQRAPPPEPAPDKEGAYSWGKAPRFDGRAVETGPLARLIAADEDPFALRSRLGDDPRQSSTLNRLIARVQEFLLVRDMLGEWLDAVDVDGPLRAEWTDDFTGEGAGLWGASRGALSHWVRVEDGEIANYQIISPTLWNLGPRDEAGNPSILEYALEGMAVEDPRDPVNVMRTIRSFDPCLGCAVHVQAGGGERFVGDLEPPRPGTGAIDG
ncbi:Ni,Fe-hydrogenase I large subunit [Halapricum desulfuricans]|uniref:Ni,Fe-hydrogenase I large subunit n=1 Tax=Halapricum desulfuricans TaxID=2841257 RepID=A0A897NII5_9EURY|nr:nickel-dependent hydrogenase large subunit [Halapricum desulfuricans]QSG12418.1 Ni,Fe-hydrogenase I large subunit [Halapricum desulfuricans]